MNPTNSPVTPGTAEGLSLPGLERLIIRNQRYVNCLLVFLAAVVLASYYLPLFFTPNTYTDDMCEHVVWYYSAGNPELFKNDIMKTYFTSMTPVGYKMLFDSVCRFIDPRIFGEILSLVLGSLGVYLAYKLGEAATSGSKAGGIIAASVLLFGHALGLHEFIKVFQGGLQRAFALPILLLGTWSLLREKVWSLCASLIIGALLYPPMCVILVAYATFVMGFRFITRRETKPILWSEVLITLGTSFLCAVFLVVTKATLTQGYHWTVYTLKDIEKMPEFYPGGIWLSPEPILYHHWSDYITHGIPVPHAPWFFAAMSVFLWRARRFRAEALLLAAAALTTWGIAYLTLLNMFEPSRFIPYPLMTLWIIILPVIVLDGLRFIGEKVHFTWPQSAIPSRNIRIGGTLVVVTLIGAATAGLTIWRVKTGQGGMTGTAPAAVYNYLGSLPTTVKIAAHPVDANDIPMRSKRSVLAFAKAMFPYHREFYELMKTNIITTVTALYATNYDDILALRHRCGADVLVVNTNWYGKDPLVSKPFDAIVQDCRNRLAGATPLVLRVPRETVMLQNGSFTIIDLAKLDRLENNSFVEKSADLKTRSIP